MKVIINVKTYEERKKLFILLDKKGYVWNGGQSLVEYDPPLTINLTHLFLYRNKKVRWSNSLAVDIKRQYSTTPIITFQEDVRNINNL